MIDEQTDSRVYVTRETARMGAVGSLALGFALGLFWATEWILGGVMALCGIYALLRSHNAETWTNPQEAVEPEGEELTFRDMVEQSKPIEDLYEDMETLDSNPDDTDE